MLTAVYRYSVFDYAATFLSFVAYSVPVFWAGLMAQLLFSVQLAGCRWPACTPKVYPVPSATHSGI